MSHFPAKKSFHQHQWKLMENRNGKLKRYWIQEYSGDNYNISFSGPL
jgi:hypothetical protein